MMMRCARVRVCVYVGVRVYARVYVCVRACVSFNMDEAVSSGSATLACVCTRAMRTHPVFVRHAGALLPLLSG
jgi:hypothetical protein